MFAPDIAAFEILLHRLKNILAADVEPLTECPSTSSV